MPEFVPVSRTRQRYTFGRAHDLIDMPDMIEVQRDSYQWFYQDDVEPDARRAQGLQELLQEIFPIESYDGQFSLEFVCYYIDPPTLSEEEARQKDMTWSRSIRRLCLCIGRKRQIHGRNSCRPTLSFATIGSWDAYRIRANYEIGRASCRERV